MKKDIVEKNPQRVVITGSSGVLGQHILRQLLARPGTNVLAVHRRNLSDLPQAENVRHETVDFSNQPALASLIAPFQPTCIIHCAADGMVFPHVEWFNLVRFNVDATLLLFEIASRHPGCHFVHISTGLAYRGTGRPHGETDALDNTHPYGASKGAADLLLRSAAIEFDVPLTVFRPFSFTGPGDNKTRLFPCLLRAAAEGQPLPLSPGGQVRDFCSAHDIARAVVMAFDRLRDTKEPAIFNLGGGRCETLRSLVQRVVNELDLPVRLDFGALAYGPFEPMHLVADISRAGLDLGWHPRHNLAHAVWQLAAASFPGLKIQEPRETISC